MCLMATPRFLSVDEIGLLVDGYEPGDTPERQAAFRRMFERDKDDLRELGIPRETGSDSAWDYELGYRIRPGDYALPDVALDAVERLPRGRERPRGPHAGRRRRADPTRPRRARTTCRRDRARVRAVSGR